ncbi:MAG: GreA/GreB family elongation factor [Labilithrix sp.]|nr:GreA/GreB family elongation factor [Labilithrix sp.]MCW5811220.1 GreA/GreB family elongation factor [Labilithrix sp.]
MSKAFTKEDDDAGFAKPPSSTMLAVPTGPFRLTAFGAAKLRRSDDERVREALALAEIVPPIDAPDRALLGVVVRVRDEQEHEHEYRLVSAAERALLGEGCSVDGPLGRALLGARVGDTREVALPRGRTELEVVALVAPETPPP